MSGLNAMVLKKTTRIIRNKLYLSLAISLLAPIPFYLHAAEEPVAAEEEPIAPAAASATDTAPRDTAIPDQNGFVE